MRVVEVSILKYKKGKHPKSGEIVWADVFSYNLYLSKEKSIERLLKLIKSNDKKVFAFYKSNKVILQRIRKDSNFNTKPEVVFTKNIQNKKKAEKAIKRLAKYLTKIDKDYMYFGALKLEEKGENIYILSTRNTEVLSKEEKNKQLKFNLRGRRSAISRAKNKIEKIKREYRSTLFPLGYKEDKRYLYLRNYIKRKEKEYKEYLKRGIESIETVVGAKLPGVNYTKVLKVQNGLTEK